MNVEEIVKTTLQAEILKALKAAPEAIEAMVSAAIEKPVDEHTGKPDGYSSKRIPFLEWIVGETLRSELRAAVVQELSSRRDEIRQAVKVRLSNEDIVDAVTKSIVSAAAEDWRINVKFESERDR